jgi:hypothetical protein
MNKLEEIATARVNTLCTSVRLDARTIATIGLYAHKQGERLLSYNDVVRFGLEILRELVIRQDFECNVESTEQAVEVIKRLGLGALLKRNRNARALAKQLSLEDHSSEGFDPLRVTPVLAKEVDEQAYREALEAMEEPEDLSSIGLMKPRDVVKGEDDG